MAVEDFGLLFVEAELSIRMFVDVHEFVRIFCSNFPVSLKLTGEKAVEGVFRPSLFMQLVGLIIMLAAFLLLFVVVIVANLVLPVIRVLPWDATVPLQ